MCFCYVLDKMTLQTKVGRMLHLLTIREVTHQGLGTESLVRTEVNKEKQLLGTGSHLWAGELLLALFSGMCHFWKDRNVQRFGMCVRSTRTHRVLRREFESKGLFNDSTGTSSRLSSTQGLPSFSKRPEDRHFRIGSHVTSVLTEY